jgi:hypothetical protein
MTNFNKKAHWENIYATKTHMEVSWHQEKPIAALEFLRKIALDKEAAIIDIGGGESLFLDNLAELGFKRISILDISNKALQKAQKRTTHFPILVDFVESDILSWQDERIFEFWHDRAVFHFLTVLDEKELYKKQLLEHTKAGSYVLIGTFSDHGPLKCSGIEVSRYSLDELKEFFAPELDCIFELNQEHTTPFNTTQDFSFCGFRRES